MVIDGAAERRLQAIHRDRCTWWRAMVPPWCIHSLVRSLVCRVDRLPAAASDLHRWLSAPGTRIGTGAAPEPPKTPLGLLGLVVVAGGSRTARHWAVWAGGDILGGGYRDTVPPGTHVEMRIGDVAAKPYL